MVCSAQWSGLSQLLEEFFFSDVVPEAYFGDNVVQCPFSNYFVDGDSYAMLTKRCDLPQHNMTASLSKSDIAQRFKKFNNLNTTNLRKLWHRLVLPQIVSGLL